MLSFAKKNITAFSGQSFEYPLMFALFKLCGGLFCFFCNSFLCLYSENITDVVKDFVAVQVISQVDDLMAVTVTADDMVENLRLYISNKRMRRSDPEIWQSSIVEFTEQRASEIGGARRGRPLR